MHYMRRKQTKQYKTLVGKWPSTMFVMTKKQFDRSLTGDVTSSKVKPSTRLSVIAKDGTKSVYRLKGLSEHRNSDGPKSGHFVYWTLCERTNNWVCVNDNSPITKTHTEPLDGILFAYEKEENYDPRQGTATQEMTDQVGNLLLD